MGAKATKYQGVSFIRVRISGVGVEVAWAFTCRRTYDIPRRTAKLLQMSRGVTQAETDRAVSVSSSRCADRLLFHRRLTDALRFVRSRGSGSIGSCHTSPSWGLRFLLFLPVSSFVSLVSCLSRLRWRGLRTTRSRGHVGPSGRV
jgi:hypothetical protein